MGRKIVVLVVIIACFFHLAQGQHLTNLSFEVIDNTNGLGSDEVYTTAQDEDGFLWFGTSVGISRYDGYEFETFKHHPHLRKLYGNKINKIYTDSNGNFYVCSTNGLLCFDSFFDPILVFAEEYLKGVDLFDVIKAASGMIYASSGNGFYFINPETREVGRILPGENSKMPHPMTKQIVEDKNGNLWVGSWGRFLLRLNEDSKSFEVYDLLGKESVKGGETGIYSLFIDSYGFLWAGSWRQGLFVVDISDVDRVSVVKKFVPDFDKQESIAGDVIFSIQEDGYNNIWIGTPSGCSVIQYPLSKVSKVINYAVNSNENGLSSNVITHVFKDHSGVLWLSSNGGGVNKLHIEQNKFPYFSIQVENDSVKTQQVYAFETDKKERIFVGVLSRGFLVYDRETKAFNSYTELPAFDVLTKMVKINTVRAFMWDRDSALWIGSRYNGLIIYHPKTKKIQQFSNEKRTLVGEKWVRNFRGRGVNVITSLSSGSVLVGTDNGLNLLTWNQKEWVSKFIALKKRDEKRKGSIVVTGIVEHLSNKVVVATEKDGLFVLSFEKGDWQFEPLGLIENMIICLFKDVSGSVWVGTKGDGLYRVDASLKDVSKPDSELNVLGDIVYGVNQDKFNNIWLTSNQGLSKLWYNNDSLSAETYFYRDGLQGNVFLSRSFYKDEKGDFYIGGYNGFNIFDPQRIKSDNIIAPVVVTNVFVEGKRINYKDQKQSPIRLNHKNDDISIKFSSLSFINPASNKYAYKILELDKEWKFATSEMRSANYNNMPAGKYTFVVKGSNSHGVWNKEPATLKVIVDQAPYKTGVAIVGYVIIMFLILVLIYRQRLKVLEIKQRVEIAHLERSKSEKLNQYKLHFFTNISHELLTPITILSSSLYNYKANNSGLRDMIEVMDRNIVGLERLVRQLLIFRKVEDGRMEVRRKKEDVSVFMTSCLSDFKTVATKKNIRLNHSIEQGVVGVVDREKWELIVRNMLSNAFKYNKDNGTVLFTLKTQGDAAVLIEIADSGIGMTSSDLSRLFDRFYRVNNGRAEEVGGIGIGLSLTKSLIDLLGGEIRVESKIGEGTRFSIVLPLADVSNDDNMDFVDVIRDVSSEYSGDIETTNELDAPINESYVPKNRGKTILVVEDNDDLRKTIKEGLSPFYNVLEADDGIKGLEMAEQENIDLVVSDVMMPRMVGTEMCVKLKSSINTSHIPVVLLTAKVGEVNRAQGYEFGADSYLEKPVSMRLLVIRVDNLLLQMEKFRQRTIKTLNIEPDNVVVTSKDEEFFSRVKNFIEKNISDSNYSIKALCDDLEVSNSMLYRKMTALTGGSPNVFMRNYRLKRAAKMLENKTFAISEVAYGSGFNDLSYFGVCFKKMFGVTPSMYQSGEREPEKK